nr:Abi family protein [uncultured Prevotella sp.]
MRSAIFVLFNTFVLWRQTRLHINLSLIVDLKMRVARQFNLPQHEVLESWMRSVTVLRNRCAHHSRLWNRYLSNAPQMNASLRGAWVNIDGVDAK